MTNHSVGPAVRRIRDAKDMTQKELAERAGLHPNALLAIEKGRSQPKQDTLYDIAKALGVTVDAIEEEAERVPVVVKEEDDDKDEDEGFRTRINSALAHAGMTQSALAKLLSIRAATVNGWCSRGTLPRGSQMVRLPELLNVSGHWLLTGDGPMHPSAGDESARLQLIGRLASGALDLDEVADEVRLLAEAAVRLIPPEHSHAPKRKNGAS